jgi:hypothetical protein
MPTHRLSLTQRIARQLRAAAKFLIPRTRRDIGRGLGAVGLGPHYRRRRSSRTGTGLLPGLVLGLIAATTASADTVYIDSRLGNDGLDGSTQTQVSDHSGPVRTLTRAVRLVGPGDQIILANNGTPYMGGLSLYGLQQSGSLALPIQIIGNGCVLSGAKPVDPAAWQMVTDTVWSVTPFHKGWYQLVLDEQAVPETPCPVDAATRPELPENSWCAFQGRIYYRPPQGQDAPNLKLSLADEQVGLSLVAAEHIVVRDLTIRHFRQDGVNLFDRCREVTLVNVTCEGNGRAGIVVGGTSSVQLLNVTSRGNRVASLLIEDLGTAEATDSTFDIEPTVQTIE